MIYHPVRTALTVLMLPTLLALAACEEEMVAEEPVVRPVKAMKVTGSEAFGQRMFSGRAKATNEVNMAFRVQGQLMKLPVNVGDELKKGDLVAQLDPATYKAEVDRQIASLKRAEATHTNDKLTLKRNRILLDKGHVSEARVDRFIAAESRSSAEVAAAKAAVKQAQLDLGFTDIQAPFAGRIVATYVENFEDVRAKQSIARLLDSSSIEMVVDIPESLISYAPEVEGIVVVYDAFPEHKIPATIKEIGTEASETTRTYPVTLIMDQPEGVRILPGMAGKASGTPPAGSTVSESRSRIEVPTSATFSDGENGKTYVWIVDEASKKVSRREVSVGELTDFGIQIQSGLEQGEVLVTAGVHSLREGQQVRLLGQGG